jgi:hypothetical protein
MLSPLEEDERQFRRVMRYSEKINETEKRKEREMEDNK